MTVILDKIYLMRMNFWKNNEKNLKQKLHQQNAARIMLKNDHYFS